MLTDHHTNLLERLPARRQRCAGWCALLQPAGKRSVHHIQFDAVLGNLQLMGRQPDVEYYGVEPAEIDFSQELSPEVVLFRLPDEAARVFLSQ